MKFVTRKLPGPSTKSLPEQREALRKLEAVIVRDGVPGTKVSSVDAVDGRWIATIREPVGQRRQAAPPPFADDSSGDSPSPEPSGPPSDSDDSDGPPKKKDDGGGEDNFDGGDEKAPEPKLGEVFDLLKAIATKVGVPVPGELGPGGDEPPLLEEPGPPGAGPIEGPLGPGAAGPKKGPGGAGKPLRPGETPNRPGAVPPGAPAFSKVNPFPEFIGKARSFDVYDDEDPGRSLVHAREELNRAVVPHGYAVDQIKPQQVRGQRVLAARVSYVGSVDEAAKQASLDPDDFA